MCPNKKLWRFNNIFPSPKGKIPNAIHSVEDFDKIIKRERKRADRDKHQFSLVVFDMGPAEANFAAAKRIVRQIARRARNVDEIGWYDKLRIGVVMPYTHSKGAWELADSICQSISTTMPPPACAVYTYPSGDVSGSGISINSTENIG